MTYSEPERLALELQRLLERRMKLREILKGTLQKSLTDEERADAQRVVDFVEAEVRDLEARLESLRRSRPGDGA